MQSSGGRELEKQRLGLLSWTAVHFERAGVRTAARIELWLDAAVEGASAARVVFAGADLDSVAAGGADALSALTTALATADAALAHFSEAGGKVLQHQSGYGLVPFAWRLAALFRSELRPFAPREDVEIVGGPTPNEFGDVVFDVRVETRHVRVLKSPGAIGGWQPGDDLATFNAASRLVSEVTRERRDEMLALYKVAARLRRTARNPRPFDAPRLPHVVVRGEPVAHGTFVGLNIGGAAVALQVFLFNSGGVVDECEHWASLPDDERNAALASALDYALANREKMTDAGLDMDLFEELYG